MKLLPRLRGPRLSTKLVLLGLALLVIPSFSYRQLAQMESLLVQIQSQALLLNAEGISTLFNGREDLFNDLPLNTEQFEPLFAHPLPGNIRLDAATDDWDQALLDDFLRFPRDAAEGRDGSFSLLLGERADQLYALMRVTDETLVYRDTEYLRLDNADHVRLSFIRQDGEEGRISLVLTPSEADAPATATGFVMDEQWRFAATGAADNRIQGRLVPDGADAWLIEFRFPLELLGSQRFFGVTWVDVDDPVDRTIESLTQSLPTAGKEAFNLVVLRSPEVRNIIQGLGYSGARILVIDDEKRVRAETGAVQSARPPEDQDTWRYRSAQIFSRARHWIETTFAPDPGTGAVPATGDDVIARSLAGEPMALRRTTANDLEIIMAAYPIVGADEILGTVVVEQTIDDILAFQRTALEEVIFVSVVSLFVVLSALLVFAGRLAWRIRSLRREASAAIDSYGRLRTAELRSEMGAGDEIGDLARAVSNMLSRLHRHNTFLENMPRTLRHEINNPLNALSTSLQNLAEEFPELESSKYLDSATRGVHRIGSIVQNLADAANLEESLAAEELELIDLKLLVESYVANCSLVHKDCAFEFRGPNRPAYAMIADFRIEQLLDKIIDNAVDFHRADTLVRVQLDVIGDRIQLTVANRGPVLPENLQGSIFDSMVSHRGVQNRLHFGLGLYVVRVIAEKHGGFVRAMNLVDGSGVALMLELPLAAPPASEQVPIIAARG